MSPITFTNIDFQGVDPDQDDPMVITVEVENFVVKKILIDQRNSVDILYWKTYQKLQIPEAMITLYDELIYGFSGERVCTKGYIDLHAVFRDGNLNKIVPIQFLEV